MSNNVSSSDNTGAKYMKLGRAYTRFKNVKQILWLFILVSVWGMSKISVRAENVDVDEMWDSINTSQYYENTYFSEGLNKYINFVNLLYEENGVRQEVEIVPLDEVLKEAKVSSKLIEKISEKEGVNPVKDEDFYCLEAKEEDDFISTLFKGNEERSYFEISSKQKDEHATYFYIGKMKESRPDGEGALFVATDTGIRLSYVGEFCEGKMSNEGITFSSDVFGSVVMYCGERENNLLSGDGVLYNYTDIQGIFNFYYLSYLSYYDNVCTNYSSELQEEKMTKLVNNSATAQIMLISTAYASKNQVRVKINLPIIKPIIKYEGKFSKDEYSGKGKLYSALGTKLYDGKFKNGKYHGKGILYYPEDEKLMYDGNFKYGEYDGKGVLYYEDGQSIKYKGSFNNGKYDGKGTLYNEDGSVRKSTKFDNEVIEEKVNLEEELGVELSLTTALMLYYSEVGEVAFFEEW